MYGSGMQQGVGRRLARAVDVHVNLAYSRTRHECIIREQ